MSTKQKLACGSCRFLSRDRKFAEPCSATGKLPTSAACPSHSADVFTPAKSSLVAIRQIGAALAGMKVSEVQCLAAALLQEGRTRKAGFRFGQKIYIRVQGTSAAFYLNNFASAYVLDADKEHIRLVGDNGCCYTLLNSTQGPRSFWSASEFRAIRDKMVQDKAFADPALEAPKVAAIPDIDQVDPALLSSPGNKKRGLARAQKGTSDLVDIVSRMAGGRARSRRVKGDVFEINRG